MLLRSLQQLEPATCRTVVINVNTDLVAVRALLSAIDVAKYPVLFVNSAPTEAGRDLFEDLMATHDFDLIEVPLRDHGINLDWLFTSLRDDFVLLLDSDAELLEPGFVEWMLAKCEHPLTFGAGFTQGPFYLREEWDAPREVFLYLERAWIPCVTFDRALVQSALDAGHTFMHKAVPNEFPISPRLSRFFAARWGPPWGVFSGKFEALPGWVKREIATWRLDQFRWARRHYHGLRPGVAVYDTGTEIYEHLRLERQLLFAGIPVDLMDAEVHHYSGVTRYALVGPTLLDTDERTIEDEVIERLADRYGYEWHAPESDDENGAQMTTPTWGASSERYEANCRNLAYRLGLEDVASPVVTLVGDGQRVLDLGCGAGHTARLLAERGCSVVGVEVDDAAAVNAAAWCERVVVCDLDVTRLDEVLAGEVFDVVVAGDVLEHLRDPGQLLASIAPLLAEDGQVVASIPNVAHGSVRLALLGGSFQYADTGILDRTHLRFFTAASARELFESAHYVIDRFDRCSAPIEQGAAWDADLVPPGVAEAVATMPEATTFSFLVVGRPTAEARAARPTPASPRPVAQRSGPPTVRTLGSAEAQLLRKKDRVIAWQQARLAEIAPLRTELENMQASPAWKAWVRVRPYAKSLRKVVRKARRHR